MSFRLRMKWAVQREQQKVYMEAASEFLVRRYRGRRDVVFIEYDDGTRVFGPGTNEVVVARPVPTVVRLPIHYWGKPA